MSKSKITLKKPGAQMGCTNTDKPEHYSQNQLSLVHDLLFAAQRLEDSATEKQSGLNLLTAQVFKLLPEMLKLEYNYSNWNYNKA